MVWNKYNTAVCWGKPVLVLPGSDVRHYHLFLRHSAGNKRLYISGIFRIRVCVGPLPDTIQTLMTPINRSKTERIMPGDDIRFVLIYYIRDTLVKKSIAHTPFPPP